MKFQHKHKKSPTSLLGLPSGIVYDVTTLRRTPGLKVLEVRNLTDSAYVIRLERNNIEFTAGQHIVLGLPGDLQMREYSIYSGVNEPYLEVLIKEVETGLVSKKLHWVSEGDVLKYDGPFGFFTLDERKMRDQKYLFIATGTGISPFHSIIRSYPGLNYSILHGVRYADEAYEKDHYPEDRYTLCTSRDLKGDFKGRVTDYLSFYGTDSATFIYLCGNCEMIYDVYDQLSEMGFNADRIKTEVYF